MIDNPRQDEERIRLAIAERAGACTVEPAPGGAAAASSLERRARPRPRRARPAGWPRTAAGAPTARSRRSASRRPAGAAACSTTSATAGAGAPEGRCCDVCDPDGWLPSPETIEIRPARARRRSAAPPPELSAEDAGLFEALKAWRLDAAAGKPAYTVAHNRTLEAIAASRPDGVDALAEIHGIGPAFVSRHADEVLRIVADQAAAGPRLALGP